MKKLLVLSLIVAAPAVSANRVKTLLVTAPLGFVEAPVIQVYSSDGEAYDSVDDSKTVDFNVGLQAECRSGIKRNRQPYRGELTVAGFALDGPAQPDDELIPYADSASGKFRFVDGAGQSKSAPALCQAELARRLSRYPDKSKYEILAQGFYLEVPNAFAVQYTLTCQGRGLGGTEVQSQAVMVNSRIECTASDLAAAYVPAGEIQISATSLAPMITAIELAATPEKHIGTCPANVVFSGALTSSRPGKVTYRVISGNGTISPEQELVFNQAGTLEIPKWQREISLDTPPDLPGKAPANNDETPAETDDQRVLTLDTTMGLASVNAVDKAESPAETGDQELTPIIPDAIRNVRVSEPVDDGEETIENADQGSTTADSTTDLSTADAMPDAEQAAQDHGQAAGTVNAETLNPATGEVELEPEKNWGFVGWEQIEILTPKQDLGGQVRFWVDCLEDGG